MKVKIDKDKKIATAILVVWLISLVFLISENRYQWFFEAEKPFFGLGIGFFATFLKVSLFPICILVFGVYVLCPFVCFLCLINSPEPWG